jgi:hypothetical protein
MKRFLFLLGVLFTLCAAAPLRAQTLTTVSGQVLDPKGLRFAYGTLTATVVPPSGGATPYVTATGATLIAPTVVTLDNTGSFSFSLVANGSITPASTTYTFTVCPYSPEPAIKGFLSGCGTVTGVTISGSTQNLSTTLAGGMTSQVQVWNSAREYNTAAGAGTSSISATTMVTAPAVPLTGKTYTFQAYVTQTVVGSSCAGNTTVVVNLIYQDPNAAAPQTQAIGTYTVTTNGTLGIVPLTSNAYAGRITFVAAPSTAVQYSATYTAGGSCSPAPTVQVFPVLQMN